MEGDMEVDTGSKKRHVEVSKDGPPIKRPTVIVDTTCDDESEKDIAVQACMESNIFLALKGLKNEHVKDLGSLQTILGEIDFSDAFIQLVTGLTSQLIDSCNLSESVSGDKETFDIDVKGVLRELGCPYPEVMGVNGFKTVKGRLLLLDFLVSEVQAVRINSAVTNGKSDTQLMEIDDVDENPVSSSISKISKALKVPLVANMTELFKDMNSKLSKLLSGSSQIKEPLLQKELTAEQWKKALMINDALCQEYKMRRDVLIKRVDVTIQSFSWSDRTKGMAKEISSTFDKIRSKLYADSLTSIVDVLAARKDLCIIEKTCHGEARKATTCKLNKHMMSGRLPDRGGRPSSVPPPPDMPKFQQRKTDGGGGRGGFGGGGRGGYGGGGRGGGGYGGGRGGGHYGGGHGGGGYSGGGYKGGGGGGYQGGGGGYKGGGGHKRW